MFKNILRTFSFLLLVRLDSLLHLDLLAVPLLVEQLRLDAASVPRLGGFLVNLNTESIKKGIYIFHFFGGKKYDEREEKVSKSDFGRPKTEKVDKNENSTPF